MNRIDRFPACPYPEQFDFLRHVFEQHHKRIAAAQNMELQDQTSLDNDQDHTLLEAKERR